MNMVDKVLREHGILIGRLLLGFLFVFSGAGIVLGGVDGFSEMIALKGFPLPVVLAWLVVVLKVAAGLALMLGYRAEQAALALLAFTLVVTVLYHGNLEDPHLLKNLAIMGGLLYAYVYGAGNGGKIKAS